MALLGVDDARAGLHNDDGNTTKQSPVCMPRPKGGVS